MKKDKKLAKLRGDRLKTALDRYGLIQASITRDDKIKESQVSDWISGKVCISERTLKDIIEKYLPEVRLKYLLGYDDHMSQRELQREYISENTTYNDSSLAVLESALKEVCIRENKEVPLLENIPELLLLQAQLKDYAVSLMWHYVAHRENSEVWSYLDNIKK